MTRAARGFGGLVLGLGLCLAVLGPPGQAAAQGAGQTSQLSPVAAPPEPPFLRIDAEFHTQVVNCLAQDREGRIVVTASDDKTIRIWQADDGAPLATLRVPIAGGDEGAIYAVAISPDGKTLLAGGHTGVSWDRAFTVYIFDLETQRLRGRLPNLPAAINHLAFAPDGRSFAIALGGVAGIRIIDAADGRLLAADDDFRARATWVDFDLSGRLVAASFDGDVRLYDAAGRRLARRAPVPGGHPYAVAFSPDGHTVAVGYADQPRVELLSAQDLAPRASLPAAGGRVAGQGGLGAVAWGQDGSLFAAGSLRNAGGFTLVRHWALGAARPVDWPALRDTVFQVTATEDGGVLLVGADPALLRLDHAGHTVFRKDGPGLDFRDMADQRFVVSADGVSVQLQTKTMATPWLVNMAQRSVSALPGTRAPTPVAAPSGPPIQVTNWRNTAAPRIDGRPIRLEPEELSRSYALAPAKSLVVLGTDYQLRVYRRDGRMTDSAALPGPAWAVGVSGDGRTVVAAVGDGTLRWFGLDADGQLDRRISLFLAADGRRWVAWTTDGLFDHSDTGGKELVGLQLNRARAQAPDWFSFAQVYRLFYAPDAVASQLQGQAPQLPVAGIDDLRRQLATTPPPGIELLSLCWTSAHGDECHPVAPSSTARAVRRTQPEAADAVVPAEVMAVRVRYRLSGEASATRAVDLFVNGHNNGRAVLDPGGGNATETEQSVVVDFGLNQVQLRAYDRNELTYAQSRVIEIARAAAAPSAGEAAKPRLFILSVGIDRYPSTINSLAFAVADAHAVAAMIKGHAPPGYAPAEVTELYDEAASASNVLRALAAIGAKAGIGDTVLIYLSGHGVTIDKRYYFVTQNVTSFEAIPANAISESALVRALAAIQARNALVFLDTCHAGAFSLDSASQIAHETGRYILAAAASLEEALDSYDDHNGVFATAVLRGLAGGAVSGNKTIVNNFDLGLFVAPLVHQLATERHHNQSARFKIAAEDAQPFSIVEIKPKDAVAQ